MNYYYLLFYNVWDSKHTMKYFFYLLRLLSWIFVYNQSHKIRQSQNIWTRYLYIKSVFEILKGLVGLSDLKHNIRLNKLFISFSFLQSTPSLSHQMSSFREPVTLNCLRPTHDPLSHLSIYFLKVAICISRPCELQNSSPLPCHIHN